MNQEQNPFALIIEGQAEAMGILAGALATLGDSEALTNAIKAHLDAHIAAGTISPIGQKLAIGALAGADAVREQETGIRRV